MRIVIDMQPRGPLRLLTATFDVEMDQCPEDTVLTEGHVHLWAAGHPDETYMSANIARATPISGIRTVVTSTNQGVDPRKATEVVADPARFGFFLHTERNPVGGAGVGQLRSR